MDEQAAWKHGVLVMFAEVADRSWHELNRMDRGWPPQTILDPTVDDLLVCIRMELGAGFAEGPGRDEFWRHAESIEQRRERTRDVLTAVMSKKRAWLALHDDELEHALLLRGVISEAARVAVSQRGDWRVQDTIDRWLGEG